MTTAVQNLQATRDGSNITVSWNRPEGTPESGNYHYSLRLFQDEKSFFIQSPAKNYTQENFIIDTTTNSYAAYDLAKSKVRVTAHDGQKFLDYTEIALAPLFASV